MKVTRLKLTDDRPDLVTVEMTTREAIFIAELVGSMSPSQADKILPGYTAEHHAIYGALAGGVFNRFWDDGVDGAIREESR